VNGNEVKIKLDMNFIEGANWIAYINDQEEHKGKIVPINEIWLDSEDKIEFMPYILLHELTEVRLMLDHDFDYSHAHDIANIVEKQARIEEIFR